MEEGLNEDGIEKGRNVVVNYISDKQSVEFLGTSKLRYDAAITTSTPKANPIRRYWHVSEDKPVHHSPYTKTNTTNNITTNTNKLSETNNTKSKAEKKSKQQELNDMSVFHTPVPKNVQVSIQFLEDKERPTYELETSDEDEVIVVALPPKPTITIESSDEDDLQVLPIEKSPNKTSQNLKTDPSSIERSTPLKELGGGQREVSASPVPSTVSSISDEFIRRDCIALNISSGCPEQPRFDFSLHGTDLLDQRTPKKKKKKKNKDKDSNSANITVTPEKKNEDTEEYFATPKNTSSKKKQKRRSLSEAKEIDHSDSESNHLSREPKKSKKKQYSVSEGGIPNADVYESDSNQSAVIENNKETENNATINETNESWKTASSNSINVADNDVSPTLVSDEALANGEPFQKAKQPTQDVISLIEDNDVEMVLDNEGLIEDSIVIANVIGLLVPETSKDDLINIDSAENTDCEMGSTNVPTILSEVLDFDELKNNSSKRYSLTGLREDMEKFYNESWGGENFNHREIQKNMSRDKSLWVIDAKDRMPSLLKKKAMCSYCNRPGHRDDMCRMKPPVCHMCGDPGHYEPRCPHKICINCGSPNYMYTSMCRNCSGWNRITCPECGQTGHPFSHCPDIWRRYHNTIDDLTPLEENRQTKKHYQLFCSGCTRRGHLVHTCRLFLPFTRLPINSPYVAIYRPVYPMPHNKPGNSISSINISMTNTCNKQNMLEKSPIIDTNPKLAKKRRSKSPTAHTSHMNKRRDTGASDDTNRVVSRKTSECLESTHNINEKSFNIAKDVSDPQHEWGADTAADFIPLSSSNHDKRGLIIQDNEVSDTSDVVTTARIFASKDLIDKLASVEGGEWLKLTSEVLNVEVSVSDITSFLFVKGKVGDQEAFQAEIRNWTKPIYKQKPKSNDELEISQEIAEQDDIYNIPKNRYNALRKLNKAFASLKRDIGDPNFFFKELNYFQKHHKQLLNQKVVSSKQVSNNRDHINDMLKKLNMVLLGQAGLADGTEHLNKLHSIQEKLISYRQKNISNQLRQEIGQHYHLIFAAVPRDDYGELLKEYHSHKNKPAPIFIKANSNNDITQEVKTKPVLRKQLKTKLDIIGLKIKKKIADDASIFEGQIKANQNTQKPCIDKTKNKLVFYHKRILRAHPSDAVLLKTRMALVNKLHSHITTLGVSDTISSKSLKKIKKLQEQAMLFLNNV